MHSHKNDSLDLFPLCFLAYRPFTSLEKTVEKRLFSKRMSGGIEQKASTKTKEEEEYERVIGRCDVGENYGP